MGDYYVEGPTQAERIRRHYEARWDPGAMRTWRWEITRPLLKLYELAAGKRVSGQMGRSIKAGSDVMRFGSEELMAIPDTHPQDRAAYEARIHQLENQLKFQTEQYQRADAAAIAGENLARALRRVDRLIDENGRDTRGRRRP